MECAGWLAFRTQAGGTKCAGRGRVRALIRVSSLSSEPLGPAGSGREDRGELDEGGDDVDARGGSFGTVLV